MSTSALKSALVLGMSILLVSCFSETMGQFRPDAEEDLAPDSVTGENCFNGVDDDGDDFVDCDDQDCWEQPACDADADTDSDDPETDTGTDTGVDTGPDTEEDTVEPDIPPDVPIGTLYVESLPAGATLTVDSTEYGTTPITIFPLLAGEHSAELRLAGYHGWDDLVTVPEGDTLNLDIELEVIPENWRNISGIWTRDGEGSMWTITQSGDIVSGFPGGDIIMDWPTWSILPAVEDEHYMESGHCNFMLTPMECEFTECIYGTCTPGQRFHKSP